MARGVLMERHGWSPAEAARQLADMAGAAGMPLTEMAAAVLRQEPPSAPDQDQRETGQASLADQRPPAAWPGAGEWLEPGQWLGSADDPVAMAAAARARDGRELSGVLAEQLRPRFGVAAVAIWLLDADGSLELLGQDGLGGADSSRWRRLPPKFDCPEQRVATTGADLWWPAGPPARDQVTVAAPWGRGAARVALALRHRSGALFGVVEVWWQAPRKAFDASTRERLAAAVSGFGEVLSLRMAYGPLGSVSPSPAIFAALDEIAGSALVVRPLRDTGGEISDFAVAYLSPGYADPAGRPAIELAGQTLLSAYPAATAGDGLFARAVRVLTSGHAEHVPGVVGASLSGGADIAAIADLHAVPFFAGVLFTWRTLGKAELLADLLDHTQRLGSIGGWEERFPASAIRWTDAAFALFGLDPALAAPIPVAQLHSFVIAADRAPVRRFQEALLSRRESAFAVFRIVRPADSAVRQIRVFAEPLVADGRLVAVRGAFQDVSALYQTQAALEASQNQLADSEQRAAQEHQLALRLQRAIMPPGERPVETSGVDVAVRYRSAEGGHLVGGDWYDALLLPGKDLLLVVGDITGHGIDAVTGMVAARNALRGLAATGAGPAELLKDLNYAACHLTEGIAGTVVCGRYEPETRVLRWARAGHLPPVLVRDGAAEPLPLPDGVLLGLDPSAEYQEFRLQLRVGDILLLFTDGLIERRAGSISDTLDQLTMVAAESGPDAAATADRLLNTAISDTGDDACLVAVRIL
jgi:serine phosphatase RsbU (regulator of sigma subunit)